MVAIQVEQFDFDTQTWHKQPDMPIAQADHATSFVANNKLGDWMYVMGGNDFDAEATAYPVQATSCTIALSVINRLATQSPFRLFTRWSRATYQSVLLCAEIQPERQDVVVGGSTKGAADVTWCATMSLICMLCSDDFHHHVSKVRETYVPTV